VDCQNRPNGGAILLRSSAKFNVAMARLPGRVGEAYPAYRVTIELHVEFDSAYD